MRPMCTYLPSRLHLSKQNNYINGDRRPLDTDSIAFLQQRFGRHACFNFQCCRSIPDGTFIDWNGDGNAERGVVPGRRAVPCLPPGRHPADRQRRHHHDRLLDTTSRTRPQAGGTSPGAVLRVPVRPAANGRLQPSPGNTADGDVPGLPGPLERQPTPQPYAYFLLLYGRAAAATTSTAAATARRWACRPRAPYIQQSAPTVVFVNAGSFQIISAGRDGKFGAGGANWNPASRHDGPQRQGRSGQLLAASAGRGRELKEDGPCCRAPKRTVRRRRLHAGRDAGGDRHHRHPGVAVGASRSSG